MVKILVFGDSISWGAFDKEKGGWVERLKSFYLKDYEKNKVAIYNLGTSGSDTNGTLKYLEYDIKRLIELVEINTKDLILLFSIGSNDPYYTNTKNNINIKQSQFIKNIEKIIEIGKKHTNKIVFTGLMKVDDNLTQPWTANEFWDNQDIIEYDKIIENICKEQNIDFIPLINLLNIENDLEDGLHPNSKGHTKIYNCVKKYLEKNIL